MSWVICLLRGLFGTRKCTHTNCDRRVFTLIPNTLSNLAPLLALAFSTGVPQSVCADELQYQYYYANIPYSTLSAAEAAMRSSGDVYQNMQQYKQEYDTTKKQITFKYKVYDIPAYQVGPITYTIIGNCGNPLCYSVQEAYDTLIAKQLDAGLFCNVTIVPTDDWHIYGSIGFGIGPGHTEGQIWPDGVADSYKIIAQSFDLNRFWKNANGCNESPEVLGYPDGTVSWTPWGCPAEYNNVTVNSPYDTCQITTEATITATVMQFPSCNAQTAHPIAPLTGDKLLRHEDIVLGDLHLNRYYHSVGQTLVTRAMAPGWQYSYSQFLMLDGSSSTPIVAVREDGSFVRLRYASSVYQSNGGLSLKVEKITSGGGFTLKLANGVKETYATSNNRLARLTTIEKPHSPTITVEYDSSGRISFVRSATGEYLEFGFSGEYQVDTITDSTGRVWTYGHDAYGNLTTVLYPDNTQLEYHYEDSRYPNYVTGVTDQRGIRYSTFAYDEKGRAKTSYLATDKERVDLTYGLDGIQIVTNSKGNTTYAGIDSLEMKLVSSVTGPGCAGCGGSNTNYTYETGTNNLSSKIVDGTETKYYSYDKGQVGYKIEAYGTAQARRTDYKYDSRFHNTITKILEPSVINTSPGSACTEGTTCKVTAYTYDDWGNRLTETISGFKPDGSAVSRTNTYQYAGPLHQLSQIDGPRSDVNDITTYAYYADDTNQGNNRARLQRVTDANNVAIRDNLQYTATGKLLSDTRPNGLTLSYTYYTGNDRLETLTESDGTSSRVTRWTYLATGEVQSITQADGTSNATTLTFDYDDARRLTRLTDGLGNYLEYTLDTEGNREFEKTYDSTGALKKQLAQTFDTYNRLDTTTQANETSNPNFAADGTLDSSTDGKTSVTDYSYDALKRLTQTVQNQAGTDITTKDATTAYDYDSADRLTTVTDPVNGNTTYAYDDLGNLLSQTSPDTGTTTFTYDDAGNLKTKLDANAQTFTYTYDLLNRLTLIDGPSTADDISYVYDTCTKGLGRLCSVTRVSETATYSYDAFGGVLTHQGLSYAYDSAGRVKELTYPGGAKVVYTRDSAGQISRVDLVQSGVTYILLNTITYHPFGPLASGRFGNNKTLSVAVDDAYRSGARSSGPLTQTINTATGYDGNGNLLAYTGTESPSFSYDALDRLNTATATSFGSRDYDYDKNGNRTQLISGTTTSYSYTPNSNRLSNIGAATVSRDANGNTTAQNTWTYTYDKHNRLTKATNSGSLKATYTYNGLGQRVKKLAGTITTRYVYGLNGELLAETSNTGAVQRIYSYLNDTPLAVVIGTTRYFIHTDHLGTPKALTATSGTKVWSATHDPFGLATVNEDADGNGVKVVLNLRFPGQYFDAETGLHYNYFRTYDPGTGRYLTADPLGVVPDSTVTLSSLNLLYVYANNNPVNLTDPYGLLPGMPWPWPDGGPFGPVCGPANNRALATWIPDIYRRACEIHDKCYEDCSKTKQQCDEEFRWIVGGGLGRVYDYGATRTDKSQEQFDKAREKCECQ